jgi:hypothetical protein
MNRYLAFVLVVSLVLPPFAGAIPVDHDAPDGIAAITTHITITHAGGYIAAVVLGTDGQLYLLDDQAGDMVEYDYPYELELSWPVVFETIVDWTPLHFPIEGTTDFFIHPGVIRCVDGSRWMTVVKTLAGGWDMAGQPEYDIEWVRMKGLK